MRAAYETRRTLMVDGLCGIEGFKFSEPQGAFYIYANVSGLIGKTTPLGKILANDLDIVEYLLLEGGVATVCGAAYGLSPYLRLSFASSENAIVEGCKRLRTACERLN